MEFVFMGFDQLNTLRRFTFEGIAADHSRIKVVVIADLTLARHHAIQVQHLPLLCRQLLESCDPAMLAAGSVTLTEVDMEKVSSAARAAVDEFKPRRSRAAVSSNVGSAWRGPANAMLVPKPR